VIENIMMGALFGMCSVLAYNWYLKHKKYVEAKDTAEYWRIKCQERGADGAFWYVNLDRAALIAAKAAAEIRKLYDEGSPANKGRS
jgi:hypothetical protein